MKGPNENGPDVAAPEPFGLESPQSTGSNLPENAPAAQELSDNSFGQFTDASEERVSGIREAVDQLKWSFPFRVVIARMDPREERLVESLGLDVHYPASDAGGAP